MDMSDEEITVEFLEDLMSELDFSFNWHKEYGMADAEPFKKEYITVSEALDIIRRRA